MAENEINNNLDLNVSPLPYSSTSYAAQTVEEAECRVNGEFHNLWF
jgi:hypothetical protein